MATMRNLYLIFIILLLAKKSCQQAAETTAPPTTPATTTAGTTGTGTTMNCGSGGSTVAGGSTVSGGTAMCGGSTMSEGSTPPGGSSPPSPGGSSPPSPGGSSPPGGSPSPGGSSPPGSSPAPGGNTPPAGSTVPPTPAGGGSTPAGGAPTSGGITVPVGSTVPPTPAGWSTTMAGGASMATSAAVTTATTATMATTTIATTSTMAETTPNPSKEKAIKKAIKRCSKLRKRLGRMLRNDKPRSRILKVLRLFTKLLDKLSKLIGDSSGSSGGSSGSSPNAPSIPKKPSKKNKPAKAGHNKRAKPGNKKPAKASKPKPKKHSAKAGKHPAQCLNPNQNYGYCISLYDCPSLFSVLEKKPLTNLDKRFLRESECRNGYGRPPSVCCTYDTEFYNEQQFSITKSPFFPETQEKIDELPYSPECGADSVGRKILSGVNTELNEFPWLALLEYRKWSGEIGLNCAGSLISNRFILTAAHCVSPTSIRKIGELRSIRLGEYDTSSDVDCTVSDCADPTISIGIEKTIPHENYKDDVPNRHNDIALIKLNRNVKFSEYIRPICLPFKINASPPNAGEELTVAGWGRTLTSRRSDIKQKLLIPIADQKDCNQKYNSRGVKVADSQICAGGILNEDSCDGDSGGPLMRFYRNSWALEGIVSFGIRCGYNKWPAVYTRVASFENWIKNKIK